MFYIAFMFTTNLYESLSEVNLKWNGGRSLVENDFPLKFNWWRFVL